MEVCLPTASTAAHAQPGSRGGRSIWAWVRILGGVCILALLVWQVGIGPFLDGVRVVDASALLAALGIGVLTTVCCAWRWRLVAAGLGVYLPLRGAVWSYYRSQFLNTTLPGGVIGDVHRAVRHGLDIGDVGTGIRAVVLERLAGQTVQIAIAVIVLFAFPSPIRSHLPVATAGIVATGLGVMVVAGARARDGSSRWMRTLRAVWTAVRPAFARRTRVGVVLASCVVVTGHLATFLLAARTAGSTAPLMQLVPLMLLALLAMALPVNIGGWGPREGMCAWAFAAAGLTATQGVATAVTYGVLVLVASLPGAGVLVVGWISRKPRVNHRVPDRAPSRVPAFQPGGAGG